MLRISGYALLASFFLFPKAHAAADNRPVLLVVGMSSEAKIARGPGVEVVVSAGNGALLRERLKAYSRENVRAVLSFGVAGALEPTSRTGDLFLSGQVVTPGAAWNTDPALEKAITAAARAAGVKVRHETDLGEDGVGGTSSKDRWKLHVRSGADLVDNESHIAAAFAAHEGLPFGVVRTISDEFTWELPPAALIPLRPDGSPDGAAILKSVAEHPGQIGMLIKLAVGENKALGTLRKVRERLQGSVIK